MCPFFATPPPPNAQPSPGVHAVPHPGAAPPGCDPQVGGFGWGEVGGRFFLGDGFFEGGEEGT